MRDQDIYRENGTTIEPLSCCLHGLRRLNLQPGDSVAIFGADPIGISHMIIAKKIGAGKVAVIDMVKTRLEGALTCRADTTFNTEEKDWKGQIFDYFGPKGVDVIITTVPSVKVAEIGYGMVKNGGKMLIFGGLPHGSRKSQFREGLYQAIFYLFRQVNMMIIATNWKEPTDLSNTLIRP